MPTIVPYPGTRVPGVVPGYPGTQTPGTRRIFIFNFKFNWSVWSFAFPAWAQQYKLVPLSAALYERHHSRARCATR
eukprot:103045-Rhodomonas_salina.1